MNVADEPADSTTCQTSILPSAVPGHYVLPPVQSLSCMALSVRPAMWLNLLRIQSRPETEKEVLAFSMQKKPWKAR